MAKKSKSEETKESKGTLDIALRAIEKNHPGILKWLSQLPSSGHDFISTGSLSLDYALGGGIVRGRITEIYGEPSSGKSTLAMSVVAQATAKGLTCLYIDAERALDTALPSMYGVSSEKFILEASPLSVEEHFDIVEKLIASGDIGVCVIDSVSSLITKSELEAPVDKDFMGKLAKFLSEECRRLVNIIGETGTSFIFINQVRQNLSPYGENEVTSGGNAIKFYATHRIKVKGGKAKSSRILDEKGAAVGHRMDFEVIKNKIAPPYRSGSINLIYGEGYDTLGEVVDLGVDLGIISKAGAWLSYGDGDKHQGRDQFRQALLMDESLYGRVKKDIQDILKV